jgi:leukotriene-A4 hydrolase
MASFIRRPRDPNTLSNYTAWVSRHITANFEILFDQKKLVGNVTHQLQSMTNAESKEIILDSSYLDIIEIKVDGQQSKWELLPRVEPYGSALNIQLDCGVELEKTVEVDVCSNVILTIENPSNAAYRYQSRPQINALHCNG